MMYKLKRVFTRIRVIILVIALILAVLAIHPKADTEGVAIRTIIKESAAYEAGMQGPKATDTPTSREVIKAMNNIPIKSVEEFGAQVEKLEANDTVQIKTDRSLYRLTVKVDNATGKKQDLGIKVYPAPKTNIKKGLDLEGGTRVLLKPETKLSVQDTDSLLDNMKQRLNLFGLTDIVVRATKDLSGNQYILVEIAGANEEEVKDLLAKQGKFEAKIGNDTAFVGGRDIVYVCRSAECAGIDPQIGCGPSADGQFFCRFRFSISLTPESAQHHADITKDIPVVSAEPGARDAYLEKPLDLYLDNEKVDTLQIGEDLKGRAVTEIAISGSGTGVNRETAVEDALKSMKRLQTVLITGSLPVKLAIVKTDEISPVLGSEFIRNSFIVGFFALIAVVGVLVVVYRKLIITIPIMITLLSEILILLGFAALIGWELDLAAIAGLIIAIGTGVDDQIVMIDEALSKKSQEIYNWKQRIKNAFIIIMAAYFTTVVAMVPLLFAGAGLLKGFAFTSIVGISIGVFITRPAFAAFIEELLKE